MGVAELTGYLDTASTAALALGQSLTPHSYNSLLATALLSGGLQGGGLATLALTSGSVTPSSADLANGTLVLSGTLTGNVTITMPSSGMWAIIMSCTGAYTVTFQCGTGSVKYAIPALKSTDETAHQAYYITSIICSTNSVFGDRSWRIDGSNANGSYIKFGDGTLECYGQGVSGISSTVNNNIGTYGLSYSVANVTLTFPHEFISTAYTPNGSCNGVSASFNESGKTTTAITMYLIATADLSIYYRWRVIGRWKA